MTIGGGPSCQCEDFTPRQMPCQHGLAARIACARDQDGKAPVIVAGEVPDRPTYQQN